MENQNEQKEMKQVAPRGAKYVLEIDEYKAYLKPINRAVLETALGMIMPVHGSPKLITAGEMILNSCWIDGDEIIKTDDELLIEACLQCVGLIERKSAQIKKL